MRIIKKLFLFFIVTLFLVGCQTAKYAETSEMESKYFEIAQKKIKELGMNVKNMECQDKSAEWKSILQKRRGEGESNDLYQKLTDKDFVAIYCGPKNFDVMGGDVNIFIDRNTYEVIDVLRGQ